MQVLLDGLSTAFIAILNMSITASVIIVFVFLARLALKRAPRVFSYALWAVVLFRLLCPISFELPVAAVGVTGVLPSIEAKNSTMQYMQADWTRRYHKVDDTLDVPSGAEHPFLSNEDDTLTSNERNDTVGETLNESSLVTTPEDNRGADDTQGVSVNGYTVIGAIWLFGAVGLMGTNCLSLLRLKKRLCDAMRCEGEAYAEYGQTPVYQSDAIPTAFVLGVLRPCIYLPSHLSQKEQSYILQHEQTHIARFDPLWQSLAFFALCLHWFNPLVWLAFQANQKDMELSCDEHVLRQMGSEIKKEYAQSLLNLSQGQGGALHHVLAFGESGAKSRIKNVLSYRKPVLWVSLAASAALIVAAVLLLANPRPIEQDDVSGNGIVGGLKAESSAQVKPTPTFAATEDDESVTNESDENFLARWITVDDADAAVICIGNKRMTLPNQSDFAFAFPWQGDTEMEVDPAQKTAAYFLKGNGDVSSSYFEIVTYSGTTFCQSTFRALEGEESELLTADGTTSIFVKTKMLDGVTTVSYRPSGSELIVTSVVETAEQQAIVQAMVQSYGKDDALEKPTQTQAQPFEGKYGESSYFPVDYGRVYGQDMTDDTIAQLWEDIFPRWKSPYAQYIADSDGDGTDEIFALIVDETVEAIDEIQTAELWCYHDHTCEKLSDVSVIGLSKDTQTTNPYAPRFMTVGTRNLFSVYECSGFYTWANVYTVQDGEVIVFEAIGQSITQGDETLGESASDFTITKDAYDGNFMPNATNDGLLYTGRTNKPYYLYWDEENCIFREYGAVEENIASLSGFGALGSMESIVAQAQADSQQNHGLLCIDQVYHFANDKYKINYHFGNDEVGDCYYLAYRLENHMLVDETPHEHSGLYLPAVYPEVAVYPDGSESESLGQTGAEAEPATYPTPINVPAAEIETLLLDAWYEESPEEMFRKATPNARKTTSDLDEDGNLETWFLVEDYNRVVALVVEAQPDGTYIYLGMTDNLWQYDGETSTSLQLYQGEGQSVAYAQCVRGGAVAAAGTQGYEVFTTIEDNVLICDTIYYTSLAGETGGGVNNSGDAKATYYLDLYSGEKVSKEAYFAQQETYLCGASLSDEKSTMGFEIVENYEAAGSFSEALGVGA